MESLATLEPTLREAITSDLKGETVLAVAKTNARLAFKNTLPIYLFALPWLGFSMFLLFQIAKMIFSEPAPFSQFEHFFLPAFMLPFLGFGIYLLFMPYNKTKQANRSAWVLTQKRVSLYALNDNSLEKEHISLALPFSVIAHENADGTGSIDLNFGTSSEINNEETQNTIYTQNVASIPNIQDVKEFENALIKALERNRRSA